FDGAQIKLLSALAADLSFALDAHELERHRTEAIQALRTSERLFALIHDRSPFAIVLTQPDGRIVSVNDAFLALFECNRDCVTGKLEMDLGINDPESRARVLMELESRGFVREFECTRKTLTGKERIVSLSLDWVEVGNDKLLLSTIQDITDRKHIEAALASANVELGQAVQRKNEFMAILSHELRNPLAAIKTSLFVMEKAAHDPERSLRALKAIDRQVLQLTRLVDDLLDMTRITHAKVRLERNNLEVNDLVQQSLEDHWSLFDQCTMRAEFVPFPEPLFVVGDSHRLEQVLGNLLQNATKFAPHGGTIRVLVEPDAAHRTVAIRVVDTGAGMSQETLARLFQPFMQADTTLDRSQGGLGLGLALVKGIVELHGGTVQADSAGLGAGATFSVRLPLDGTAAACSSPVARNEPARSKRRRVLIIEDNRDAAETLREALEYCEHDAHVAHNGSDGLSKAMELRPDVIICDIGLPGMSGYEFARAIRADAMLCRTKLIALSGYARSEDRDQALVAGFDRHFAKPPSLQALEELLADLSDNG
ncbi:MAG TPA: ATP-binding protein, partial [Polyangiaceae bacterium]